MPVGRRRSAMMNPCRHRGMQCCISPHNRDHWRDRPRLGDSRPYYEGRKHNFQQYHHWASNILLSLKGREPREIQQLVSPGELETPKNLTLMRNLWIFTTRACLRNGSRIYTRCYLYILAPNFLIFFLISMLCR